MKVWLLQQNLRPNLRVHTNVTLNSVQNVCKLADERSKEGLQPVHMQQHSAAAWHHPKQTGFVCLLRFSWRHL